MQLDDFRQIDIKTAGDLPVPVKAILLLVVMAVGLMLGYLLLLNPKLKQMHAMAEQEQALRNTYMVKKMQAIQIVAYERQMQAIQHTFGTLLKQLPDKSQMDALLTDINHAGLEQGLSFESFIPKEEIAMDFYAEKPIQIKVVGHYHALGDFASAVAGLSRIVTLNDLVIQPSLLAGGKEDKTHKDQLVMEATAKTYRYLDESEIAARRAQERKGAKP